MFYFKCNVTHIRQYLDFQSTFIRSSPVGWPLQRITNGSTSEADGPTTESSQCSRPLPAACSSLQLQCTRESQRSASQAAYATASDFQAMYHGVQVLARKGTQSTSRSCAFQFTDAYRSHLRLADKTKLKVPRHKLLTYGPRAFGIAGPTDWNSLYCHLWDEKLTLEQFRSGLKTHLFHISYNL